MTTVYLGLGSNVDARHNIQSGMQHLRAEFGSLNMSPVYLSKAVGFEGDDFINLAVAIETELSADELREFLRDIEDRHGRLRNVPKFSDRVLDIDILLFGDAIIDTEFLQVPRPEILYFAHVFKPLAELAPNVVYPGKDARMSELWNSLGDHQAALQLIDAGFLDPA